MSATTTTRDIIWLLSLLLTCLAIIAVVGFTATSCEKARSGAVVSCVKSGGDVTECGNAIHGGRVR